MEKVPSLPATTVRYTRVPLRLPAPRRMRTAAPCAKNVREQASACEQGKQQDKVAHCERGVGGCVDQEAEEYAALRRALAARLARAHEA